MKNAHAPRRVERILESLGAGAEIRDAVVGDLAEEFAVRIQSDGPSAARRWYYRESAGIAPYLLRGWWNGLRRNDVRHLARVLVLASATIVALEYVLQLAARGLERTLGTSLEVLTRAEASRSVVLPALMLVWTLGDGALAGYVAARLGRRAPLPTALALGVMWTGLILLAPGRAVPPWFRAANGAMFAAGVCAGGVVRAGREGASTATTVAHPPSGRPRTSADRSA